MATRDLLIEIGTEELPPKALSSLSRAFEEITCSELRKQRLEFDSATRYATPRRLALLISGLQENQPDRNIERFGPAVKAAYDGSGEPTKAAQGFARSCGVELSELSTAEKDGVEKLCFSASETGKPATELLAAILDSSLAQLPIPKRMRWGSSRDEFVRPVHWAVLMLGEEVLSTTVMGVKSGAYTWGHRFHHNEEILIEDASDYEELLEETGGVIPDFDKRKELVRKLVQEEGTKAGGTAVIDEALLEEVSSLVEYPVALSGMFEDHFLEVPAEALILAMKSHQKCFYLVDENGDLLPRFITVSNIVSKDPMQVIEGNERVIRPRLADARFFFETDKKEKLESRQDKLKKIVFQDKLGTVYDKSERVARLASYIAERLHFDGDKCHRAAMLSKCDLLTNMVGEFADLQGLMGYYYALNDGEDAEVAQALNEQYKPRYSGDSLPESSVGSVLAVADKLDSMVGMFGIGQPPTGSKDPFALRRSALGILRILVEKKLDLNILETIEYALSGYNNLKIEASTGQQVFEFLLERFRAWYLDEGISSEVFQSVLAVKPERPLDFHHRIDAVHNFTQLAESQALAAANKRVSNLLAKQEDDSIPELDSTLLTEASEKALSRELDAKVLDVTPLFEAGNYNEGLKALASLKSSVDTFFDEVLVMSDDPAERSNRLALLQKLRDLFLKTADISYLHTN